MHPTNHKILYAANKKIMKSTNAGTSFQVISGATNVAEHLLAEYGPDELIQVI